MRHSWPMDMLPEVMAVERELDAIETQRNDLLAEVIKLRNDLKRTADNGGNNP
jgi:hypothetical protein